MAPFVSIILPCYNRATYLEKCVKSVLAQTFTDLECILVDDGSTDNTREIAESLMNLDSRVKYFYKENGGLSSARNFGIQNSQGDWIQCLDPDDWIHEDKTRFQLSYLSSLLPNHPFVVKRSEGKITYFDEPQRRGSAVLGSQCVAEVPSVEPTGVFPQGSLQPCEVYVRAASPSGEEKREEDRHSNTGKEVENQNVIFYCDYERVYLDNDQNILKREVNIVGSLTREQLIQRLFLPDFLANSPFPLLQQCLLIKKDIFKNKFFDNRLKALQDRDFALDLLQSDVNFVYTPIVGAFYTKHQTNMSNQWDYMKKDYIVFYEIEQKKHESFRKYCQPALEFFINEAIQEKDKNAFDRLAKIVQFPVHLLGGKLRINNAIYLNVAYKLRLIIPSFILYQKYRGPRSKQIISILSKLPGFGSMN